jgi:hypothetical protein
MSTPTTITITAHTTHNLKCTISKLKYIIHFGTNQIPSPKNTKQNSTKYHAKKICITQNYNNKTYAF